ncbi:glycosyl hydrolases family 18-domain-containing protein [Mrakia frigida]|uniref:putative chitinase n=1 Tax=Mrakia frigida TaxID=29902 RepID=UPI003FCBF379
MSIPLGDPPTYQPLPPTEPDTAPLTPATPREENDEEEDFDETSTASLPSPFRNHLLLLASALVALSLLRSWFLQGPFQQPEPPLPSSSIIPTPSLSSNHTDMHANGTQAGGGKRSVGYFVNWGIYDRKYLPQQIPAQHLTHILYAFANITPETGAVRLSDPWADEQIHWEGDSWNEEGNNLYGCFKQIQILKKANRHLKLMLSIGGWTYSANFTNLIDQNHQKTFAQSAVTLLEDYGLDGLDIDWEYPKNPTEAQAYTGLLRTVREELDEHARKKDGGKTHFELSIAAPCGSEQFEKLDISGMDRYLDFWNLMAYDFAGAWSNVTSHQAALYGPSSEPSVDAAVQFYKSRGVRGDKLVIGMPLYGRTFAGTAGLGSNFTGVGEGTWEKGMVDYRTLPKSGAQIGEDLARGAGWSYDASKREFTSFDTPNVAATKAHYIRDQGLGGAMYWELDADLRPEDSLANHALVPIVANEMGGLDRSSTNCLEYKGSKWDNLRKGTI